MVNISRFKIAGYGAALIFSTIFIVLIYSFWALLYSGSFLPAFGVKEPK